MVGVMAPPTSLASVDLPAPEGPMIAVSDPGRAPKDTSLSSRRPFGSVRPSPDTSRQSPSATTGGPAGRSAPSPATTADDMPVSRAQSAGGADVESLST